MRRWARKLGALLFAAYIGAVLVTVLIVPFEAGWLKFIENYQTLLVGAPGLLAISIALQQRRLELRRDTVNLLRGYEPEFEALDELRALVDQAKAHKHPSVVGALLRTRSTGDTIAHDLTTHIRTASAQCRGGVSQKAAQLCDRIDYFNNQVMEVDNGDGAATEDELGRVSWGLDLVRSVADELLETISNRHQAIQRKIELYLEIPSRGG